MEPPIPPTLQPGETVQVEGYKSDEVCYRRFSGVIESVTPEQIVVVTQPGHRVEDIERGFFISKYAIRSFYWPGKWYSLLEVFFADGSLYEVYVNINSPVMVDDHVLSLTDHELDVSRIPPKTARLVDEDEFEEAVEKYGYSGEFIEHIYNVGQEAIDLANRWEAGKAPV